MKKITFTLNNERTNEIIKLRKIVKEKNKGWEKAEKKLIELTMFFLDIEHAQIENIN